MFAPTMQIRQGDLAPIESSTFSFLRSAPLRADEDSRVDKLQSFALLQTQTQPESLSPVSAQMEPQKAAFRPLIANVQSATPFEAPLAVTAHLVEDEQEQHASAGFASQHQLSQTEAPGLYRPLVRASATVSNPLSLPHQAEARAAGNPSAEVSGRPSPAREPDEIHIHIGRIEVAAISQPAPRPAAPPARKSLDLSDYLKRGNGRSR
jgi:hypothetical protein